MNFRHLCPSCLCGSLLFCGIIAPGSPLIPEEALRMKTNMDGLRNTQNTRKRDFGATHSNAETRCLLLCLISVCSACSVGSQSQLQNLCSLRLL